MAGKRDAAVKLEHGVERHLAPGGSHGVGLFLLVFLSVVREGVESVIFLGAARFGTGSGSLWGALAGLAAASLLGFLLFRGAVRVRLGLFFTVTNVLLLLFAAGLVAHGLHELVEAGWLPALVDPVWDLNPLLPEQGLLGSLLRGLFGYNGNPSLLELLGYAAYAAVAASLWRSLARKRRTRSVQDAETGAARMARAPVYVGQAAAPTRAPGAARPRCERRSFSRSLSSATVRPRSGRNTIGS
jgi:high-affinity iron transporter